MMIDDEEDELTVFRIQEVRTFTYLPDRQLAVLQITAGGVAIDYFLTVSELASLAESLRKDAIRFRN